MLKKIIYNIIIAVTAAVFAAPLAFTLYNSFKGEPGQLSPAGYRELFLNCFSFYPAFWNSCLYTAVIIIFQCLIAVPAAFAFLQLRSRIIKLTFVFYIVLMMMPLQVTLLPNYIGLRDMNLLDTRSAIILPMIFSPLYVVILLQYMRNINISVIEAVRLESSSIFRIILTGVIPQIKTCIFAVIILSAAESWNILEQPMYFLKRNSLMPLAIFINNASDYGNKILFTSSVISIIPMVLIYGHFSEVLKKGIVVGGAYE